MPSATSSPRTLRTKRESMTITRSKSKAFIDAMNDGKSSSANNSIEATSIPHETARTTHPTDNTAPDASAEKKKKSSTLKLFRSPAAASGSRSTGTMGPPRLPSSVSKGTSTAVDKSSKPRSSLTLRGLSSALSKATLQPSSLPQYKPKSSKPDLNEVSRKRPKGWSHNNEADTENNSQSSKVSDHIDSEDDFVSVPRAISPLPKRATRRPMIPIAVSVTPSTPQKRAVLHKASPTSPLKSAKTAAASAAPRQRSRQSNTRPAAAKTTSRNAGSVKGTPSPNKTTVAPPASASKLELSPGNPFHIPDTSGASLLSPPLSPSLEGISLDSIDAGDVSALLATVASPIKPSTGVPEAPSQLVLPPSGHPSQSQRIFLYNDDTVPQTPAAARTTSILSTDPRQSVLSLRQILEQSGDLEHLLSQPLPSSIFTPEARERLLSFGSVFNQPEPQTPTPNHEATFSSISQILFPSLEENLEVMPEDVSPDVTSQPNLQVKHEVIGLKAELSQAEKFREARIEDLERQLIVSRETRERDAAALAAQVTNLEERVQELLNDREREAEYRLQEIDLRLKEKDVYWERQLIAAVSEAQTQNAATLHRERRIKQTESVGVAWDHVRQTASNELELLQSHKQFIDVMLAALHISVLQLQRNCQT